VYIESNGIRSTPAEAVVIPVEHYQFSGKLYSFISSFIDPPRIGFTRREAVSIRRAIVGFSLSFMEAPGVVPIRPAETKLRQSKRI
jgi:hypothetical protein